MTSHTPEAEIARYLDDVGLEGCLEILNTDAAHFARYIGTSPESVEDWIAGRKAMPQPLLTARLAGFLTFTRQAVEAAKLNAAEEGHVNLYRDEASWQKAHPLLSSVCPLRWWHVVLEAAGDDRVNTR